VAFVAAAGTADVAIAGAFRPTGGTPQQFDASMVRGYPQILLKDLLISLGRLR
jgi:hypothetical protein